MKGKPLTFSFLYSYSLIVFLNLYPSPSSAEPTVFGVKDPKNITFAFGSCNSQSRDPKGLMYQQIMQKKPDIWVWLGDAVYLWGHDKQYVLNKYKEVITNPSYIELKSKVPVVGTWDDHDFGPNNGDKTYVYKERNRQYFLDFLEEPQNSPRRKRDGVYESYYLGENKAIKIILLDVRYNKDLRINFNTSKDILGETQWEWLERELNDDKPLFTLIGSGTQVLTDDRIYAEVWYPASKERLFNLIRKYKKSGVILLSGDVHYAEILRYPCPQRIGYNLYELVSSGLTHYLPLESIVNLVYPRTFNKAEDRYFGKHYGIIKFLINGEKSKAVYQVWNIMGVEKLEKEIDYEELVFKEEVLDENSFCIAEVNEFVRFFMNFFAQAALGNQFTLTLTIAILGTLITLCVFCCSNRRPKDIKKE